MADLNGGPRCQVAVFGVVAGRQCAVRADCQASTVRGQSDRFGFNQRKLAMTGIGGVFFAPALRYPLNAEGELGSQRTELIAADAPPGKDGRANAKLRLLSGLLVVGFDELKQRELQRRNRGMAEITGLAVVVRGGSHRRSAP
ncbi:MAG: hypothetical protein ACMG5Z_01230 [Luteimonas sp.]